jgi:hypothetical protein
VGSNRTVRSGASPLRGQDDAHERQEKLSRRATECHKAMVSVKGLGRVILGVDRHRKDGKLGTPRPDHRVSKLDPFDRERHRSL